MLSNLFANCATCQSVLESNYAGHLAETVIREVLSLPFFDGSENKTGDEFRRIALGVIGRRALLLSSPSCSCRSLSP